MIRIKEYKQITSAYEEVRILSEVSAKQFLLEANKAKGPTQFLY